MCDVPLTNPRSKWGRTGFPLTRLPFQTHGERVFPQADGVCPPTGAVAGPRVLAAIPTLSRHR